MIGGGGLATLTDEDDPGAPASARSGGFLYEPDGAVIRAGLVTAVAAGVERRAARRAHRLRDVRRVVPDAVRPRSYGVLEELPFREKPLRAALRRAAVGRLTIKKRGVDVVPEQLRKRLAAAPATARRRRSC